MKIALLEATRLWVDRSRLKEEANGHWCSMFVEFDGCLEKRAAFAMTYVKRKFRGVL
jgi:hypothetical protein